MDELGGGLGVCRGGDFDGDGKLNTYEYSIMDDIVFGHDDSNSDTEEDDDFTCVGLDRTELEYMDEDERREAIEDAGLDPDDYDFD